MSTSYRKSCDDILHAKDELIIVKGEEYEKGIMLDDIIGVQPGVYGYSARLVNVTMYTNALCEEARQEGYSDVSDYVHPEEVSDLGRSTFTDSGDGYDHVIYNIRSKVLLMADSATSDYYLYSDNEKIKDLFVGGDTESMLRYTDKGYHMTGRGFMYIPGYGILLSNGALVGEDRIMHRVDVASDEKLSKYLETPLTRAFGCEDETYTMSFAQFVNRLEEKVISLVSDSTYDDEVNVKEFLDRFPNGVRTGVIDVFEYADDEYHEIMESEAMAEYKRDQVGVE